MNASVILNQPSIFRNYDLNYEFQYIKVLKVLKVIGCYKLSDLMRKTLKNFRHFSDSVEMLEIIKSNQIRYSN